MLKDIFSRTLCNFGVHNLQIGAHNPTSLAASPQRKIHTAHTVTTGDTLLKSALCKYARLSIQSIFIAVFAEDMQRSKV
uniref:Uncharacterized protein n=1 Tax=Anguilla anguilla TaxID=7936 RepID=A0A0E9UZV5_ANGAN